LLESSWKAAVRLTVARLGSGAARRVRLDRRPTRHTVTEGIRAMGLDRPSMPEWTFGPAIHDLERWDGFTQDDFDESHT
jgi:hypothetical protein